MDLIQSSSEDMRSSLMTVPGKLQSPHAPAQELAVSSLLLRQAYSLSAAQVSNQGKKWHDSPLSLPVTQASTQIAFMYSSWTSKGCHTKDTILFVIPVVFVLVVSYLDMKRQIRSSPKCTAIKQHLFGKIFTQVNCCLEDSRRKMHMVWFRGQSTSWTAKARSWIWWPLWILSNWG